MDRNMRIWTVGHSNRGEEEFLSLLIAAGIEHIADVRRFPGSRKWPHFGEGALRESLGREGIGYTHVPDLGGRRGRPAEESPNTGWRTAQFAAYADYMATDEFQRGLNALIDVASKHRTAMMCSEAVPWRCHRRIIADALIVRGWDVIDIMGSGRVSGRTLTEFAQVRDGLLIYPETT